VSSDIMTSYIASYGMVMRQRKGALGGARLAGSTVKATMIITTVNDWSRSARSAGRPFVIRGLRRENHQVYDRFIHLHIPLLHVEVQ
jgi:hypothetical protein